MQIINASENKKWNEIINRFQNRDIYFTNEYTMSLKLHNDGEPLLIYHNKEGAEICYIMMENDLSELEFFSDYIDKETNYDWSSPYGYGGPLTEGEITKEFLSGFFKELNDYCRNKNIVTQFFRFHPLFDNYKIFDGFADLRNIKQTVYMDTTDKQSIYKNLNSNKRNEIKKAVKSGVEIITDQGERADDFQRIYNLTMNKLGAENYYYFDNNYFNYLNQNFSDKLIYFYALYEDQIISAAMFFYNEKYMHYHLSGTNPEFRKIPATDLILNQAAEWACDKGITKLHLGGGVSGDDPLFHFKRRFNKNGVKDFYIGSNIFNETAFDEFVNYRKLHDPEFDVNNKMMIKYRA